MRCGLSRTLHAFKVGALRRRRRKWGQGGEDGGHKGNRIRDLTPEFVVMMSNDTCLYLCEGNCHEFIPSPNGTAVLDILFPPYNKDNGRECTYYKRRVVAKEDNSGNSKKRWTLVALVPIEWLDDFDCLGGLYGCFSSDRQIDCV